MSSAARLALLSCRVQWQEDFDCITPSLLAFFFRDSSDLMLRMEYLVATRAAPDATLKDLFKMTNGSFSRKHPNFRAWRMARRQQLREVQARLERHHQLLMRQRMEQQQQQQSGVHLQGEQAEHSGSRWEQGYTYQHQHEHAQQEQQQQALHLPQQQLVLQQQQQQRRVPQQQSDLSQDPRQGGVRKVVQRQR